MSLTESASPIVARDQSNPVADDLDFILNFNPLLWNGLRGQSLFLTGGTGWFGRWLLEAIAHANRMFEADIRVTLLTRDPAAFQLASPDLATTSFLTLHRGDVQNFDFPSGRFTHLVHAATTSARETFSGESSLGKFDTLVDGTRRVLDFAAQCGVRQMLFTSSGVAYGDNPNEMGFSEDFCGAPDPTNPESGLGQAKRAAEFLCSAYAAQHGWNLSIARCFSFVGPFMPMDLHYAIGDFIGCVQRGEPIIIKSDGRAIRSYLYTADLVIWLLTLLQREGKPRIFNVGSDRPLSIGELARLVRSVLEAEVEIRILGKSAYSVGNPVRNRYYPSIERARCELGLDVWTPLAEAIRKTAKITYPVIYNSHEKAIKHIVDQPVTATVIATTAILPTPTNTDKFI